MELVENFIKLISPKAAAHRRFWLAKAERHYQAADKSIYHRTPGAQGTADQAMNKARERVRDWARHLDENHDLAIGILDELVNKVVGTGITLEPLAGSRNGKPNKKLNREISRLWRAWQKRPEVTGQLAFSEVQRLAARTLYRDGEVLAQHILGSVAGLEHLGGVPYSIEMIECDYLPFEYIDADQGIIHGVEMNAWGRPRAYHILKKSPDAGLQLRGMITRPTFYQKPNSDDIKRVPADRMSHLKFTRRFKQTRGVSIFHGIAHRLDDIKDYEESERIAAKIAASFSAYIKKGTDFQSEINADGIIGKLRTMEFNPGMIFDDLLPGEEIGTIDTNRPNTGLQDFRNSQLRACAAGTGTSYSSISKNYDGTYSAQRQELVESLPAYARLRAYFISAFMQPIYENFITAAVLSGALMVPKSIDLESLILADWIAPPTSWIDPKKEIEADILAIDNRIKPRGQVIRERTGREPELVNEQIALELETMPEAKKPAAQKPPAQPAGDQDQDDTNADDTNADDTNELDEAA